MKQQKMMTFSTRTSNMAAPCVLIASCSDYNPQNIVKHILNISELPEAKSVIESIVSYDWHIDTKYYTADVHLCTTETRTIGDESFAESVGAFVIYFDSQEESSFQKVLSWLPYLDHINPSVQILVCQTSREDDVVSRQTALEWCIKHGFELVELEPVENSDDEDDDFVETTGPKRIIQALHAHTWPNLILKNRSPVHGPYFRNLLQEEAALKANAEVQNGYNERSDAAPPAETSKTTAAKTTPLTSSSAVEEPAAGAKEPASDTKKPASDTKEPALDAKEPAAGSKVDQSKTSGAAAGAEAEDAAGGCGNTGTSVPPGDHTLAFEGLVPGDNELAMLAAISSGESGDPDDERFEQMFARLQVMKDKAATLPEEDRKKYAEQIAVTFWRAIGGDEDEIEGLFDDLDPA